jgi:hypothetical protein
MRKLLKCKIILFLAFFPLVSSALDTGLDAAAAGTGLPKRTIPQVVAIVINAILFLLGVLFTVLLIWGGFQWMTSRGNSEMVKDAKATITNAFIGLVIVFVSYAVVRFVLGALMSSGGGGGGAGGGG